MRTNNDSRYLVEHLNNGFILIHDRRSGLKGLWNADGTPRHGDLTYDSPNLLATLTNGEDPK